MNKSVKAREEIKQAIEQVARATMQYIQRKITRGQREDVYDEVSDKLLDLQQEAVKEAMEEIRDFAENTWTGVSNQWIIDFLDSKLSSLKEKQK